MIPRTPRLYTIKGGWHRDPTKFEQARDYIADAAKAVGRLIVAPNRTWEERIQKNQVERAKGNFAYRAPERTPWYTRVRYSRVGVGVAALGITATLLAPHSTEAMAPTPTTNVDTHVAPPEVPRPEPTFNAEEYEHLNMAYAAATTYWGEQQPDVSNVRLFIASGTGSSYNCTSTPGVTTSDFITPSSPSAYCPQTDTIVAAPEAQVGWAKHMGVKRASYWMIGHEMGHWVQDQKGELDDRTLPSPAIERGANCYAGWFIVKVLGAEEAKATYDSLLFSRTDVKHGPGETMAAAFLDGAQGKPCGAVNFLDPVPTGN